MKKFRLITKTLLVAAMLLGGSNFMWGTIYENGTNRYDVVFGVPTYTNETVTGVGVQTDFTTDYATGQNKTTVSLVMDGSVLSGNQANGRTYSFTNPQQAGTVSFKATGKFVGGSYNFFHIYGVKKEGETETDNYAIVQSPYALPSGSGETTVLRIFGQEIKASYVYTPRDVLYGFDVTIDLENQKVDYVVTYASKGSSGNPSQLSTVEGSVNVPSGVTLKSVKSLHMPRLGQNGGNYYDNVAFYGVAPATTYTINYKDESNNLLKSEVINSYAGLTATATAAQMENFTKDATVYTYKSGNETITLSSTAANNIINLIFKVATTPTTYTIKYTDGTGNDIKDAYQGNGYSGDIVTASGETLPQYIWNNNVKYKYSSGNQNLTLTTNSEDNIITLVYAEAPKYAYNIKAVDGSSNEIGTLAEGSAYEGETVNTTWSKFIKNGTQWYECNSPYGATITEATNTTVTFATSSISYFVEGENMNGYNAASTKSGTNYSGGVTGRPFANSMWYTDAVETTGVYTISFPYELIANSSASTLAGLYVRSSNGTLTPIEENVSLSNNNVYTKTDVIIPAGSSFQINKGSNNSNYAIDYVTLTRTGNATVSATIGAYGYATFSSAYDLDFSNVEGLTAYIATASDNSNVTLTEIEKTPYNTGLVLKGQADTYSIPVTTSYTSSDWPSGKTNYLVNCLAETEVSSSNTGTNYVLSVQNNKAVFAPIGATPATVAAGHAYLHVPTTTARTLNIVFGDDATGISNANVNLNFKDNVYDLQGRRVAQPQKGLYIVNGKKVIVK